MRVLLVNPSHAGQGNIPVNLPILAAVLRRAGHDVRVFDFTNYEVFQPGMQRVDRTRDTAVPSDKFARPDYHFKQAPPPDLRAIANERRSYARRLGLADRLDPGRLLWDSDPSRDFEQLLDTFLPAVVGITCLTVDLDHAVAFIEPFRRLHDFRVVIGGVHARAVPESLVDIECVDAICIGDGESAFPEYVNRLTRGERLDSIPNMWVRTPDGWALNDDTWRTEMSDLPVPDFDGFDPVHFYRPFNGQLYRMLNYEWNRGCPYSCSFCMNSLFNARLRQRYPGCLSVRRKSTEQAIRELEILIETYEFDFIRFWDEDFFAVSNGDLEPFAEAYAHRIGLPFLVYGRMESMDLRKLSAVKAMGCQTIATGIESGSEWIRNHVLNRKISNAQILETLGMIRDTGIRASCYNIIGLPGETRAHIFETIQLNRAAPVASVSCTLLEPYPGTPIRRLCEEDGLDSRETPDYRCIHGIPLYVPSGIRRAELEALFRCFPLYVYLPEELFPEIQRAESDTSEGWAIFNHLMQIKKNAYPEKPVYPEAIRS